MTEQVVENQKKNGKGKLNLIIIGVIVIIVAIVAYFVLSKAASEKNTYFSAEIDTYTFLKEEVEDRFANELDWVEVTENNPTESIIDISAEYNDPFAFGGVSEVEEIVNNSSLSVKTQADMKGKELFADIEVDVAGMTFKDFRIGLTDTKLQLQTPFLKEVLQIESEDIGKLLYEMDPYTFEEDLDVDFSKAFNSEDYPIPAEDREYLQDKYGELLYDELPETGFTSEKEEVSVEGESIKAEKIVLHVTEEEVQEIVTKLVDEMENDKRLKEIIESYFEDNFIPADELEMFMTDFDEGLAEIKDNVDKINLPEGIESSIWVEKGLIVKRNLDIKTLNQWDEEITFNIEGTQLLNDKNQKLDYDISVKDEYSDETLTLVADLSWDGDDIQDNVTLGFDEFEIAYDADETLKGSTREFTRSLSVHSPFMNGGLFWTGDSTYERDQMSANHQFHVEADEIGADVLNVQLDVEGKQVKEIESINIDNVKDIGKMSEAELEEYIEGEAAEQFYEWYMEKFGALGF